MLRLVHSLIAWPNEGTPTVGNNSGIEREAESAKEGRGRFESKDLYSTFIIGLLLLVGLAWFGFQQLQGREERQTRACLECRVAGCKRDRERKGRVL